MRQAHVPMMLSCLLMAPAPLLAQNITREEAAQLYGAGGFPISADGKAPTNRCGKPANPTITFVDVNGDGRKDALFIDRGACYGADARWFSIAVKDANGRWRGVAGATGAVKTVGTTTGGWFDLAWTSAGKTVPLHYDGTRYAIPGTSAASTPPAKAPPSPSAPGARPAAAPTGDAAIFRAAGFRMIAGKWRTECGAETPADASYGPGTIEERRDLNGDGRPEAVVTEGGTYCYGNTGTGFWIVSQQADGSWKRITNSTGIPDFLKTKGVGGWPDISIGGPGFCFPVVRWNGREYVLNRREYEGKPCR
jgi:hypothetical protein